MAITPDYLIFVVSPESKQPAQKILERTNLTSCKVEYLELEAAHDLNEVFARTNDAIRRLLSAGFSAADISVNYTSGTKVMGAGVVCWLQYSANATNCDTYMRALATRTASSPPGPRQSLHFAIC